MPFGPMTADDIASHLRWRAASGHPGGWRVVRQDFRDPPLLSPSFQQLEGKSGRPILFKSHDAAKARADALNADEADDYIIVGRGENSAKIAIATLTPEQQAAIAAIRKW